MRWQLGSSRSTYNFKKSQNSHILGLVLWGSYNKDRNFRQSYPVGCLKYCSCEYSRNVTVRLSHLIIVPAVQALHHQNTPQIILVNWGRKKNFPCESTMHIPIKYLAKEHRTRSVDNTFGCDSIHCSLKGHWKNDLRVNHTLYTLWNMLKTVFGSDCNSSSTYTITVALTGTREADQLDKAVLFILNMQSKLHLQDYMTL